MDTDDKVAILASDKCLAGVMEMLRNNSEPDFTVTAATLSDAGKSEQGPYAVISWETVSAGFGTLTFYFEDGKLKMDNEAMGDTFVAQVLLKLAESAEPLT